MIKGYSHKPMGTVALGTHLGNFSKEDSLKYVEAIKYAVRNGIYSIDGAINYRGMCSERDEGVALAELMNYGIITREEVFISSKAGLLYGDFINIASKIIGNERLMKKIIDDKIDYVLPVNYKELSQMVRGLNKLFGVEFYNKDYYEEINYLFDSLVNGYHINMSTEEVETYCYQLCNYVLKRIEGEHV